MNQKEIRCYTPTGFGQYAEGLGTLRASGGDYGGGGSEMLIVDTLVFDEGQITCPTNGLNPQWGGQCHALSGNAGRTVVIIKQADYISDDTTPKVGGRCPYPQSRTEGMHNHLSDGSRNA